LPDKPATVVALTNLHGPDHVELTFIEAGRPVPDSWRVSLFEHDDYVEHLIATGGAGTVEQWEASELAQAHRSAGVGVFGSTLTVEG
jgi:hypothetical protein